MDEHELEALESATAQLRKTAIQSDRQARAVLLMVDTLMDIANGNLPGHHIADTSRRTVECVRDILRGKHDFRIVANDG